MANIKKYNGSTWETTTARKYETKSEIIVPPTTIYTDGSNITTYTIKGNTVQNGTPTPSAPIAVQGVGELDSGDYKIPISSGGVTTNIYLGSTQTVRQVQKYVYTGSEDSVTLRMTSAGFFTLTIEPRIQNNMGYAVSTHYQTAQVINVNMPDLSIKETTTTATETGAAIIIKDTRYTTLADFKAYLAQQYANGTPVTVWYCLTTAETGTVNEPLMKLVGVDSTVYADTLSNATAIPTTDGANSITVDTTVQPSEFTATWTGWHNAHVKEWDGSQWG